MLLIWGWRARSKKLGEGTFHCPTCGADRQYTHQQARRWFTLFWLPLIPLKVLGEYIECATCKSTFTTEILNLPTSAALNEQLLAATREAVVQLLRIDGSATAREAGILALSEVGGEPWSEAHLDADLQNVDPTQLPPRLRLLADVLNEHGKERFLATAASIAAGGGAITDASRAALGAMANELSMTPAHARGVIEQALEAAGR